MAKDSKKKDKKNNKYNADNEIIIGVTTKPKEKVRVENKKSARTNTNVNQKNTKKENNNKGSKSVSTKKKVVSNFKNNSKTQINRNTHINKNLRESKKVNIEKITKEEKIKKINRKKMIISAVILFLIALGGTIYYLTTPAFNISNIEIYGNEKNTVETYISLSKIEIGNTNIFGITSNGINKNIKENSYVEEVTMKRKLPNTVQIYITERKVSYQIQNSNSYIYLSDQGYILEISEEKKDVPVIEGFCTIEGSVQMGQRIIEEDLIKLNIIAKIINYCKYNTIEHKVTRIDATDYTNYIVKFEEDKKTVYLGDASNLSERLSLLKTILKNEEKKEIEIFMNGDLNEDDVYIRYVEE